MLSAHNGLRVCVRLAAPCLSRLPWTSTVGHAVCVLAGSNRSQMSKKAARRRRMWRRCTWAPAAMPRRASSARAQPCTPLTSHHKPCKRAPHFELRTPLTPRAALRRRCAMRMNPRYWIHIANKKLPIVHPNSPKRVSWDFFILLWVLYNAVMVPYQVTSPLCQTAWPFRAPSYQHWLCVQTAKPPNPKPASP